MALIPNSVPLTGPVSPLDDRDTYGSHTSKYGIGGFYSVELYSDLASIPEARLLEGEPLIYVRSIGFWYLYVNGEWLLADFSNGSSCCLIIGIEEDNDDIVTTLCRPPIDGDPLWWMDEQHFVQSTVFT